MNQELHAAGIMPPSRKPPLEAHDFSRGRMSPGRGAGPARDIHYLTPDPVTIVFCSFNVIPEWYRDKVQEKYGLPIEAWEAKNGKKLGDGLYRGTLRRGTHHARCGCAVGEQGEEVRISPITGTSAQAQDRDHTLGDGEHERRKQHQP